MQMFVLLMEVQTGILERFVQVLEHIEVYYFIRMAFSLKGSYSISKIANSGLYLSHFMGEKSELIEVLILE